MTCQHTEMDLARDVCLRCGAVGWEIMLERYNRDRLAKTLWHQQSHMVRHVQAALAAGWVSREDVEDEIFTESELLLAGWRWDAAYDAMVRG